MINWLFLWSSKRPPLWESVIENINTSVDSGIDIKHGGETYVSPVNWKDIPEFAVTDIHKEKLLGQNINQFENEFFKFVIERNTSTIEPEKELVIKPHMWPNFGLRPDICKPFCLDEIYEHLKKYKWVSIGFFFDGTTKHVANDDKRALTLSQSIIYARDENNVVINVQTGEKLNNYKSLSCVTYVNFRLLSDDSFVICTVNPNLVAVPNLNKESSLNGRHVWTTLNTYNTSMYGYLLAPKFKCTKVNDTLFTKLNSVLEISLYEDSLFYITSGEKPNFPIGIETNLQYTYDGNKFKFIVDKPMSYIKFRINTGSLNNKYFNKSNAGYEILEYLVLGE